MLPPSNGPAPLYGTEEIATVEHPNSRIVCAFLLGWLCAAGLYLVLTSVYIRDLCLWGRERLYWLSKKIRCTRSDDPEEPRSISPQEKSTYWDNDDTTSVRSKHDYSALVFTLNLCFLFAALTQFIALLSFRDKVSWDTGCAFVIAWGGMTSHVAGFVCSCILCLELRRQGARRREVVSVWVGILVALALVFTVNALSPGTTRFVEPLAAYICQRGHNLGLSIATSLVQLVINVYLALRLVTAKVPTTPRIREVLHTIAEASTRRALSVIVLNLLTLAPNALKLNLVAQYVPFSLGGLLVLFAFNCAPFDTYPSSLRRSSLHPLPNASLTIPREEEGAIDAFRLSKDTTEEFAVASGGAKTTLRVSVMSDQSFDSGILGSVENAVIATAVKHLATKFPLSPASSHSAPPRMEAFVSRPLASRTNHILPFQVEFAEQLEREIADQTPVIGPVVRPIDRNRNLHILVHDKDAEEVRKADLRTPASILGSDIIYRSPTQTLLPAEQGDINNSSTQRTSTFGVVAVEVPEKDSYVSNQEDLDDYHSDRHAFSIISQLTVGSTKSPKHSLRHFSVTSHRNKSVDELSIVPEQGFRSTGSSHSVQRSRSRRTTFGMRPVSSSSRKTGTIQVVPDVPPLPTRPPAYLSTHTLPRPSELLFPVTPLRIHKFLPPKLHPPLPAFPDSALHTPIAPKLAMRSLQHPDEAPGPKLPRPLPNAPIPNNVGGSPNEPHALLSP